MTRDLHRAIQHKVQMPGLEAVSLATNRSFPRHSHDHLGIGFMTGGAHRSWSGVGTVEAEAGDVITVNPGEMHDGMPVQGGSRSWRMLHLEPGLVRCLAAGELGGGHEFVRPVLRDPGLASLLRRLFTRLTGPDADGLAVEEDVVVCIVHALGRHGTALGLSRAASPGVSKARCRLDDAPELPATLSELARLAGVSKFQLIRSFARETGATPHAYLSQRRVQAARRHLAAGLPVVDAALKAGFADQSHMTRAFVRQLGVTPARYRSAVT